MFEIGQAVLVITDKGVSYDGYVTARAIGDNGGPPAYQVASAHGGSQANQWHRASDVFLPEATVVEDPNSIETYFKK
jgi:hypothetical protein